MHHGQIVVNPNSYSKVNDNDLFLELTSNIVHCKTILNYYVNNHVDCDLALNDKLHSYIYFLYTKTPSV